MAQARHFLQDAYGKTDDDVRVMLELAQLDMREKQFTDALQKAMAALQTDSRQRLAYQIAERAAIELDEPELAKHFFLFQPPVEFPDQAARRGRNPAFHPLFAVPPVWGKGNDYQHILERASLFRASGEPYILTVSVIIPVFNRYQLLANTLAAMTHQTYPQDLTEIIVVDDGSDDAVFEVIRNYETRLNLHYVRQADEGYRLSAARNLGVRFSRGQVVVVMDADILPLPTDIENYLAVLHVADNAVLLGHRKYVDVSQVSDADILRSMEVVTSLPSIHPDNDVAGCKNEEGESVDWRFLQYLKSGYLVKDLWPFSKLVGATFALPRQLLDKAGEFDEEFQAWGCEDGEFGFRLYNEGAYFIPMLNVVSLHQEPLQEISTVDGESYRKAGYAITQQIRASKCGTPHYRNELLSDTVIRVPKVSIYIPAYNAGRYLVEAVQSCLDQEFDDLEVCICNDGSTDDTLDLLEEHFSGNPKVRWISQPNAGIGSAANAAIRLCRGMYIGQLDADDLLKPDAVRECVAILDTMRVDAVYTDREYIDEGGQFIRYGDCLGEYSREWLLTGMHATHFRMFRKRLWSRISGCDEGLTNAADFDLWLKLSEVGELHHLHKVLYSYRWHGANTSILKRKQQEQNHMRVVEGGLARLGLDRFWQLEPSGNPLNPLEFSLTPKEAASFVLPEDVVILIPVTTEQLGMVTGEEKYRLWEMKRQGFRYWFVAAQPDARHAEVRQDVLYVPCGETVTGGEKLRLACEFLYRNMQFLYVFRAKQNCIPLSRELINRVLPQLYGKQYGRNRNGDFIRKDLLPFLFNGIRETAEDETCDSDPVIRLLAENQVALQYIR